MSMRIATAALAGMALCAAAYAVEPSKADPGTQLGAGSNVTVIHKNRAWPVLKSAASDPCAVTLCFDI